MSQRQDLKADKQLSLLLNDLAGTHQMQKADESQSWSTFHPAPVYAITCSGVH